MYSFYRGISTEVSSSIGHLIRGSRVVIPRASQEVLKLLHAGHRGIVEIKTCVRGYACWPEIDSDIEPGYQLFNFLPTKPTHTRSRIVPRATSCVCAMEDSARGFLKSIGRQDDFDSCRFKHKVTEGSRNEKVPVSDRSGSVPGIAWSILIATRSCKRQRITICISGDRRFI